MPYIGRAATNTGSVRYLDNIASGFDGSDTTFTAQVGGVSITPDQENVRIYLDGVFQHPGSGNAYTISGSTITFTEAPVANTVFSAYVVGAGAYLDDKAVSSAKLDDDAVTAAKLDDDGTGFQVGDLGVGGSLTSGDKLTVTGRARVSGGIIGDLTGDVTGDVTGNTSGTAATVTGGTQASITSAANLVTVGTIGTGVWQGTPITSAYLNASQTNITSVGTLGNTDFLSNSVQIRAGQVLVSESGGSQSYLYSGGSFTALRTTSAHPLHLSANYSSGDDALVIGTDSNVTFAGAITINTSASEQLMLKGATSPYLRFYESTTAKAYMQWHSDGYLNLENSEASTNLAVGANGIGIGTTAPENKLTVVQTENATETNITQDSDTWGVLVETGNYTAARFVGMIAHRNANKEAQTGIWSEITSSGSLMHLGTSADYDTGVNVKNMTLKYDGNVGIGTTSPDGILHTAKSNARNDVYFDTYDLGTEYSALWFRRSNSDTVGTKAQTDDGDILGSIYFQGVDTGSNFDYGAFITATQSGSAGARVPSILTFGTSDGTNIPERMRIHSNGEVYMGTANEGLSISGLTSGAGTITGINQALSAYKKLVFNATDFSFKISGTERMCLTSGGALQVGDFSSASHFQVKASYANEYIARIHNDGDGEQYYGLWIQCGHDNASDQNFAITIADGDGGEQGYVTFSGGTVAYGAFTANHDAELPSSDNSDGYPYGTLVETTEIFYKQKNGQDTERGILYKVKKSSSAYSKKVLGAYSSKFPTDMYENQHQIYVLGDGHILCNGEKGNIEIGDGICSSSTDGEGMKADKMAMIIGIAQEDVSFSGSESKLVAVQYGLQQFTPWENA